MKISLTEDEVRKVIFDHLAKSGTIPVDAKVIMLAYSGEGLGTPNKKIISSQDYLYSFIFNYPFETLDKK